MKEKQLHFGSYVLVAVLATVLTLTMVHLEVGLKPSKLDQLETLIEEMISAMGNNTKFLLIPAVAAALGASGTEAHASHKQWCIDRYGADHVFDVYEWFSSLGYTRSDYMTDTLHYNADGYAIIADGIYEKLNANGWVTPA